MKNALWFMVPLLALACSDGADWETGGAVDSEREGINGGKPFPPSGQTAPDTSVVNLWVSPTGHPAILCTALKVDARTFWTAGSCLETLDTTGNVHVTNALDGVFRDNLIGVVSVDVHPSRRNYIASQTAPQVPRHYDVGRLVVAADTPSIPAYSTVHTAWMEPSQTVTYTSYGVDSQSTRGGTKQYNYFPLVASSDAALYAHHMLKAPGLPSSALGDAGAPVFQKFGTTWKVVGIVPELQAPNTVFVRFGNVQKWLAAPAVNKFVADFRGFIFNKLTGRCLTAEPSVIPDYFNVTETDCDGRAQDADRQSWRLVAWGSDAGSFQIINGSYPACLESLTGGALRVKAQPCVAPGTGSSTQRWNFASTASPDYYQLRNGTVAGCAVPQSPSGLVGGNVIMSSCSTANDTQSWVMTR